MVKRILRKSLRAVVLLLLLIIATTAIVCLEAIEMFLPPRDRDEASQRLAQWKGYE